MKLLYNTLGNFKASVFLFVSWVLIYLIIFLLSCEYINGYTYDYFLKSFIRILIFFILFVSNWHFFLLLKKEKYRLRKYIVTITHREDTTYDAISLKPRPSLIDSRNLRSKVWGAKWFFIMIIIFFSIYFLGTFSYFSVFNYPSVAENYSPSAYLSIKEHPYILYNDSHSNCCSIYNCSESAKSTYLSMININTTLYSISENLTEINAVSIKLK